MWSKIIGFDPLAIIRIKSIILLESERLQLKYHTWFHVLDIYEWLYQNSIPYDEALDWAVIGHDLIYDAEPDKEIRSADYLFDLMKIENRFSKESMSRVYDIICSTKDHLVLIDEPLSSIMIRGDLHQLTDPGKTISNFVAINQELQNLYPGLDRHVISKHGLLFMEDLKKRIIENILERDPEHEEFYWNVIKGIDQTINMHKSIVEIKEKRYVKI